MQLDLMDVPNVVRLVGVGGRDLVAALALGHWWQFEDPLPVAIVTLLDETQGAFLDVGANTGFYSVLVGRAAAGRSIVAFEPAPDIADHCERNLRLNGIYARLERCALSNQHGTADLHFPPADHGLVESSASLNPTFKEVIDHTVVVPVRRLDEYVITEAVGKVGLIKIDVEGFECEVLEGAGGLIERDRPLLAVEFLPRMRRAEVQAMINDWDYGIISMRPGLVVQAEASLGFIPDSWNQLLVPRESFRDVLALLHRRRADIVARQEGRLRPYDREVTFLLEQLEIEGRVAAQELEDASHRTLPPAETKEIEGPVRGIRGRLARARAAHRDPA